MNACIYYYSYIVRSALTSLNKLNRSIGAVPSPITLRNIRKILASGDRRSILIMYISFKNPVVNSDLKIFLFILLDKLQSLITSAPIVGQCFNKSGFSRRISIQLKDYIKLHNRTKSLINHHNVI